MKINWKKKVGPFWMILIFFVLLINMFAGYYWVISPQSKSEALILENVPYKEELPFEDLGDDFEIRISEVKGVLQQISLPVICRKENKDSSLEALIFLDGKEIASEEIRFDDEEETLFSVRLDKAETLSEDSELVLQFRDNGDYVKGTGALGIALWNVPQTSAFEGGKKLDFDVAVRVSGGNRHYLIPMFFFLLAVLTVLYVVLCLETGRRRWKPEQIFVALGLGFGILYAVFWAPYSCPDEYAHFNTAYCMASEFLGESPASEDGTMLLRAEDVRFSPAEAQTRGYSYNLYRYASYHPDSSDLEMIPYSGTPLPAVSSAAYLPHILAIMVARIFRMNNIVLLLLGRFCSLAVYLFLGYFALKYMPFGKRAMMVLMLSPSILQQSAAFTYDCMLNSCALLFTAYLFYLAYEKDRVTWKDWLLLFVTSIIFTPVKVVYILMLFAVILIPNEKICQNPKKALIPKVALAVANVLVLLYYRTKSIVSISTATDTLQSGVEGYNISSILHNPFRIIALWANTVRIKPEDYMRHMFGGVENANGIHISWLVITGFFMILVFALIFEKGDRLIDLKGKVVNVLICAALTASFLLVFTLAKDVTNVESAMVNGIQGRYFFPFLPMLFTVLQSKNITARHSLQNKLAVAVYAMQFLAITSVFFTAAGR